MKKKEIINILLKNKLSLICFIFILLLIITGIFAPTFSKHDPLEMELTKKFLSISMEYPMGTDNMGRCIFCRIIHGIRPTVGLSLIACIISASFGIFIGMLSGFLGGKVDNFIMRLCDVLYSFPSLVLTLVIVSFLGAGITNIIIAMILVQWIWYARVTRNLTIREKELSYVDCSKLLGSSNIKILIKSILPNIFPQVLAILTIDFGHTILAVSGFSFLGLGVKAPFPEWGMMINDGRMFMHSNPMLMFWPGIMILLVVLSANIIGDQLRDTLEEVVS
ncbi:ABC transporter permease [Terrisporobacter glycolicus]|uniref:Metal-staphylopine import system permease protein CntC n=1 Tax=Terrisporobacter glycolicus ATCC 14880 = DSM 1288 TaxID=1121315 RepID=A0ABZ2EY56_9FIRM|nr:ABC transporter permease subunit [Terrisporobacter glycolicus]